MWRVNCIHQNQWNISTKTKCQASLSVSRSRQNFNILGLGFPERLIHLCTLQGRESEKREHKRFGLQGSIPNICAPKSELNQSFLRVHPAPTVTHFSCDRKKEMYNSLHHTTCATLKREEVNLQNVLLSFPVLFASLRKEPIPFKQQTSFVERLKTQPSIRPTIQINATFPGADDIETGEGNKLVPCQDPNPLRTACHRSCLPLKQSLNLKLQQLQRPNTNCKGTFSISRPLTASPSHLPLLC